MKSHSKGMRVEPLNEIEDLPTSLG